MFTNDDIDYFWTKVDRSNVNGCWHWLGPTLPTGYGRFYYKNQAHYAHRYSYTITNGPIPNGLVVCHSCDNPRCVNPSHLFTGTQKDNIRDAVNKGRHKHGIMPGSKNASALLTEQQVLEIRSLKDTHKNIAKRYGVSKYCIDDIRARNTWKHI